MLVNDLYPTGRYYRGAPVIAPLTKIACCEVPNPSICARPVFFHGCVIRWYCASEILDLFSIRGKESVQLADYMCGSVIFTITFAQETRSVEWKIFIISAKMSYGRPTVCWVGQKDRSRDDSNILAVFIGHRPDCQDQSCVPWPGNNYTTGSVVNKL